MKTQTWVIDEARNTKIDAYLWNPDQVPDGQTPWYPTTRPAILICPGGGYTHVSAREAEPVGMHFYTHGWQVFVLSYSVGDHSQYPNPWLEASRAMRFIRSHSTDFDIDPETIAIAGFSAGGHLAAWLSSGYADPSLLRLEQDAVAQAPFYEGEAQVLSTTSNKPNATLLAYAVTDITNEALQTTDNLTPEMLIEQLGYLPGKIILDQREDCSPIDAVDATHPPTFIWATADDPIVPPDQSLRYAVQLIAHGVKTEVHLFPEGGHGLATADLVSCSDGRKVPERTKEWRGLALAFFDEVFSH